MRAQRGSPLLRAGRLEQDLQPIGGQRRAGAIGPFTQGGGGLGQQILEPQREQLGGAPQPIEGHGAPRHPPPPVQNHHSEGPRARGGGHPRRLPRAPAQGPLSPPPPPPPPAR